MDISTFYGNSIQDISYFAQSLGILIVGVYYLMYLYNMRKSRKLTDWKEVHELLKDDEKIRSQISNFLNDLDNPHFLQNLKAMANEKNTGWRRVYLSPEMTDFREVCMYYETLAAAVHMKYIPYDMLIEIMPFPKKFWKATNETGIRYSIAHDTDHTDENFLEHFEWMEGVWNNPLSWWKRKVFNFLPWRWFDVLQNSKFLN